MSLADSRTKPLFLPAPGGGAEEASMGWSVEPHRDLSRRAVLSGSLGLRCQLPDSYCYNELHTTIEEGGSCHQ